MALYTDVYDYCTTTRVSEVSTTNSGAMLSGKALYRRLVEFLKAHAAKLNALAATRMDESLLHFYHTEWERYTTCVRYVNHIFQYLNRHW
jgi:cullin 1